MNWIETPYGDRYCHNIQYRSFNMRTKGTPVRLAPAGKYTYSGTRTTMYSRAAAARRRMAANRRYELAPLPLTRTPVSRFPRMQARRIGFTPGVTTGFKRTTVEKWVDAVTSIPSKTLVSEDVTAIPRKTANEINARERDMINCLGFTLRFSLNTTVQTTSLVVRLALVSPTDKNEMNNVEFFRGYADSRALDFGTTLNADQLIFNPINRDNYVVLWEKKVTLGAISDGAQSTFSRNSDAYSMFSTYVKLNRQLRYDGDSANECSDKIFLLMWYDTPIGVGVASDPPELMRYRRSVITHWKDPGM